MRLPGCFTALSAAGILLLSCVCSSVMAAAVPGDGRDAASPSMEESSVCYQIVCMDDSLEQMMIRCLPDYQEGVRLGEELKSRVCVKSGKLGDIDIRWTIIDASENAYMKYLDTLLMEQNQRDPRDRIDLFAVTTGQLGKYCDEAAAVALPLWDTGLQDTDLSEQYDVMKIPACDSGGIQRAITPDLPVGVWAYRRSVAKEVLGSDDPETVASAVDTWEHFEETAGKMKEKGYRVYSSYTDTWRAYADSRTVPWVNGEGVICPDGNLVKWVDMTFADAENGRLAGTLRGSEEWLADYTGEQSRTFGTFLTGDGLAALAAGDTASGGDWGCVCGPASYTDSCTWYCAAAGCSNTLLTGEILQKLFCQEESLEQIISSGRRGVNHRTAMAHAQEKADAGWDFCGGQNVAEVYDRAAALCVTGNGTRYDSGLNAAFMEAFLPYFTGQTDEEGAAAAFYDNAMQRYPDLLM